MNNKTAKRNGGHIRTNAIRNSALRDKSKTAAIRRAVSSRRVNKSKGDLAAELAVYGEIGRVISTPFSAVETYGKFAGLVREIIPYDRIVIATLGSHRDTQKNAFVLGTEIKGMAQGAVFSRKNTFFSQVMQSKQAMQLVPSTQHPFLESIVQAGLLSGIGTPLIANEEVVGTLVLRSAMPDAYGKQDLVLLESIGNQIAGAVASAILLQTDQGRASQLEALYEVAAILAQPLSFEAKAQGVVDTLVRIADADTAIIRRGEGNGEFLELVATAGPALMRFEPTLRISDPKLATAWVFRQGETILVNDYQHYPNALPDMVAQGIESTLVMPIKFGGRTLGVLTVASKTVNHFHKERVALITAFADKVGALFDTAGLSDTLQASREEMALTDEVARIITSTLKIQDVYEMFAVELKKLVEFDRVTIGTFDCDMQTVTIKYTFGDTLPGYNVGDVMPINGNVHYNKALTLGHPSFRGGLMTATDAMGPVDEAYMALGFCSSALIPLMSRGRLIGGMSLRSRRAETYGPREQSIILRLADQIAPAVENAILYEQSVASQETLRRLGDENAAMAKIGRVISSPFSDEDAYRRFADAVQALVQFDRISITTLDSSGDHTSSEYILGTSVPGWEQGAVKRMDCTRVPFISKIMSSETPITLNPGNADDLRESYPTLVDFYRAGLRSFLGCRLITNGRIIGTLQLASCIPDRYGEHESQLLGRIGNQVAGSIASAMLLQAEQERASQLEALYEVAAILARPLSFEAKAKGIVDTLVRIADADMAVIRRGEGNGEILELVATAGPEFIRFEPTLKTSDPKWATAWVFRQGETMLVNDYQHYHHAFPAMVAQGIESTLVMPIKFGGRTLGVLTVASKIVNHFHKERVALITAFADKVGALFDTAGLSDILQASREEMALADEVANIITSTLDIEEVYHRFAAELKKLVNFDCVIVGVIDRQTRTVTIKYSMGAPIPGLDLGSEFPMDWSGNLAAVEKGLPSFRDDLMKDARNWMDEEYLAHGFRSSAVAPLMVQGRSVGFVALHSRRPGDYGPREQAIIMRLANQIAPAVENAMLLERSAESQQTQSRLAEVFNKRSEEMDLVDGIASIITASSRIEEIPPHFCDELKKLVGFDRISVAVIDRDAETFSLRLVSGVFVDGWEEGSKHPIRGTIMEKLTQLGTPIIRSDIGAEGIAEHDRLFVSAGLISGMAIPLVSNCRIIGSLRVNSREPAAFGVREQAILERLAVRIAPTIENARLKDELDELIEGEARSRALLETTTDAVISINEAGFIESINPAAEEIFGYSMDELLGQNISILMPDHHQKAHDGYLARYRETGESHIIGTARKLEGRHKDGGIFPMELSIRVVEMDGGRSFTGIIRRLNPDSASRLGTSPGEVSVPGRNGDSPHITNREMEVLQILANGGRNKDIAAEMFVSLHTVKFHIDNLYKKLEVRTRAKLVRVAAQLGILSQ